MLSPLTTGTVLGSNVFRRDLRQNRHIARVDRGGSNRSL